MNLDGIEKNRAGRNLEEEEEDEGKGERWAWMHTRKHDSTCFVFFYLDFSFSLFCP